MNPIIPSEGRGYMKQGIRDGSSTIVRSTASILKYSREVGCYLKRGAGCD
jgi:hypothetical protein